MIRSAFLNSLNCSRAARSLPFLIPRFGQDRRPARSRVAILPATEYSGTLEILLHDAFKTFNLDLRNKSVLLKPNLVDYIEGVEINTHPFVVGAAAECFRRLGAAQVVVGEGPGHQRDTELILTESGYLPLLKHLNVPFVDLNRDELVKVRLQAGYSGLKELWLPKTVLAADFIVSMPKVKTHHWSGVTLSLKNMFGCVPGARYGWPKNILHWHGIEQSIVDLVATLPIHFVIADAIVCMEGNGPLAGTPRRLDRMVLSDDPVAADATCARLMGLVPERIPHLAEAAKFLGNASLDRVRQIGNELLAIDPPFQTLPEFQYLRAERKSL